jgi:hypothetical protein
VTRYCAGQGLLWFAVTLRLAGQGLGWAVVAYVALAFVCLVLAVIDAAPGCYPTAAPTRRSRWWPGCCWPPASA